MNQIFEVSFNKDLEVLMVAAKDPQVAKMADQASEMVLNATKERIMEKLRYALGKGGKFNVGATGTAARNFIVRVKRGGGDRIIEISEGNRTKANYFIRIGSGPSDGHPPADNIRQWLIAKRVPLYRHDVWKAHRDYGYDRVRVPRRNPRASDQVRYISPKQKRKLRPWKASETLFDYVLRKIVWGIGAWGTSKYSLGRPPVGRRYFDYPRWIAEQKQDYIKIMDEGAGYIATMLLRFILRGEKGVAPSVLGRYRTFSYY